VRSSIPVIVEKSYTGLSVSRYDSPTFVIPNTTAIRGLPTFVPIGTAIRSKLVQQVNIGTTTDTVEASVDTGSAMDTQTISETTGDVCLSVRHLTRMFYPSFVSFQQLKELQYHRSDMFDPPKFNGANVIFPNPFRWLSAMYFFNRGGFRTKIMTDSVSSVVTSSPDFGNMGNYQITDHTKTDVAEVEVPQSIAGTHFMNFSAYPYLAQGITAVNTIYLPEPSQVSIWCSGADDFSFFGLHGVPALNIGRGSGVFSQMMQPILAGYTRPPPA